MPKPPFPIREHCLRLSGEPDACWYLPLAVGEEGYVQMCWRGRTRRAHRVVYEEFVGPVPEGFELDHLCRNRACVNPRHLEAVSHRENILRGRSPAAHHARKTHCPKGHELSGANLMMDGGKRRCRICKNETGRLAYHRRGGKKKRAA